VRQQTGRGGERVLSTAWSDPAVSKSTRIQLLDILRGVAIFGTLGTNIWLFSAVGSGESLIFGGGGVPW
jgi:uncharacterized protein